MTVRLSALTRPYVLQAIDEFDALGREKFLARHGYKPVQDWFLLHRGAGYDAKPIAGVAFEAMTGTDPRPFGGGRPVANLLRAAGFDVVEVPAWRLEETVLACDLLAANNWVTIPEADPRTAELSRLLRTQWDYAACIPSMRGRNSVHQKLEDLRTAHPDYPGTAKRGGALTRRIAAAFATEPARMHALAAQLRTAGRLDDAEPNVDLGDDKTLDRPVDAVISAIEGTVVRRLVRSRERNPRLRAEKIARARADRGHIGCEVCGFDFEKVYGPLGDGFIHVHHLIPLHVTGEIQTTTDDLVLLCANCHQMVHRARPGWLTPTELRTIIATNAAPAAS
ncbi:HNH endonuclease [Nocardia asiatica]|uniref:HNH endonuclease n=1 Tax=Nocardia asiatica TaxID=209252 RepID=UPI0024582032|nr:HNH endonuclease [Nocardia asiatica]